LRAQALHIAIADGETDLHEAPDELMASAGESPAHRKFSVNSIVAEALGSLKVARIQLEKASAGLLVLRACLLYVDICLQYFMDREAPQPLVVREPSIEVRNPAMKPLAVKYFTEYTIDLSSVSAHVEPLCQQCEKTVARNLEPVFTIYCQVLIARAHVLKGKLQLAQTFLDFAFGNFRRLFTSGWTFIPRDVPIGVAREVRVFLQNLCRCLLYFDRLFVNDRLLAFDWLLEVDTLIAHRLRTAVADNDSPIDASLRVSPLTLKRLPNGRCPDFLATLEEAKPLPDEPRPSSPSSDSIADQLRVIRVNARLAEAGAITDDEVLRTNRTFVRQIESIADSRRRSNAPQIPAEVRFGFVSRRSSTCEGLLFVQRLFDAVFVYAPQSGAVRRVPLYVAGQTGTFSIVANHSTLTFQTSGGLFPPDFLQLVGLFLLCDKKQKHVSFSAQAARATCEKVRAELFGDVCRHFPERPMTPDDIDFGDRGFFSRQIRGTLYSIETCQRPIVFVTSHDLRSLPFELMFPKNLVLRAWSYGRLLLRPKSAPAAPRVVVCRWRAKKDHLLGAAAQRTWEAISRIANPGRGVLPLVDGGERALPFPFPLFSSKLDNAFYAAKYPFADFVDVGQEIAGEFALYVFTYGDFCEMPAFVYDLLVRFPLAFFMFIPAQFVREAFAMLVPIFERQGRRAQHQWEAQIHSLQEKELRITNMQMAVAGVPYDFVTLLQGTLMIALGCPVLLIAPGQ
jgi:hypothetical protein